MTARELGWIAGFLEGEGSFSGPHGSTRVTAWQVQAEPLERLQRLVGGSMRYVRRRTAKATHSDVHHWWISGAEARGLMMTVYALMSPKRQGQIEDALSYWHAALSRGKKTHCKYGHPYSGDNLYVYEDGRRACRACVNSRNLERQRKLRAARREAMQPELEQQALWTKTHCRRGHERTPENTYIVPQSGRRVCRLCRQIQKKTHYERTFVHHPRQPVTHCPQGHEYTPENTYIVPSSGSRMCRACNRDRSRGFRAAHPGYDGHKDAPRNTGTLPLFTEDRKE